MHAVIVDDSPATRAILYNLLRDYGLLVSECDNADGTIHLLHRRKDVRVVLIDWQLPPGGGYDLVRRIRSDPAICNKRLVMVTAEAGVDDVAAAIEAGIDDYLTKPFSPLAIREKLDLLGVMAA
jgi:two-component system chemotaxis response regulator CheY